MKTEKEKIRDIIVQNNLERAKYYWENPNIPMSINVITQLLKDNFSASFKAGKSEAIRQVIEIGDKIEATGNRAIIKEQYDLDGNLVDLFISWNYIKSEIGKLATK